MKIQDWPHHSGLPKKYVDAWVRNAEKQNYEDWRENKESSKVYKALSNSFEWDHSKEGFDLWDKVCYHLFDPSENPLPPFQKPTKPTKYITVADLRRLQLEYSKEEISYSRMVEKLNEIVNEKLKK